MNQREGPLSIAPSPLIFIRVVFMAVNTVMLQASEALLDGKDYYLKKDLLEVTER